MTRQGQAIDSTGIGILPETPEMERLVDQATDIAIRVDGAGVVKGISVNANTPSLGCLDHWVGRDVLGFLTEESREKYADRLAEMRADPLLVPRPIELNHMDNATWEFPVRYTLHRVADDGILLLGRDLQPIAEVQQQLIKEQAARERDLQRLRGETAFFKVVMEASETAIIVIDAQRGRIRNMNNAAAVLLGAKMEAISWNAFAQAFEGRRAGEFLDAIRAAAGAEEVTGIEVIARRSGRAVTVFPEYFRAAGELHILCRLLPADDEAATGAEVAHLLAALYATTSDAIVLTDAKGNIREANEAFLVLADAAQMRDVRGKSLADFLVRGMVDLKLILDSASQGTQMRRYAARFSSAIGLASSVEISAAKLSERGGDLGFGFIIRDNSASEGLDPDMSAMAVSDEAMRNVMDLVGTASLKDLVSATSDVVEKLCIETALQLTSNNRVAAAEMLGLSRQSLYVKLRKHGLLESGAED